MITVGLDFGTHQTKVCIEHKEGVELSYTFMKFVDTYHRDFYTLPSLVQAKHLPTSSVRYATGQCHVFLHMVSCLYSL